LTQLHQRLVEVSRFAPRNQAGKFAFDGPSKSGLMKIPPQGKQSGHNARHIAVENGKGQIVSDTQNGAGRIVADAGKGTRLLEVAWEAPVESLHEVLGRLMQVARTAVIAKARPEFEHAIQRRLS